MRNESFGRANLCEQKTMPCKPISMRLAGQLNNIYVNFYYLPALNCSKVASRNAFVFSLTATGAVS